VPGPNLYKKQHLATLPRHFPFIPAGKSSNTLSEEKEGCDPFSAERSSLLKQTVFIPISFNLALLRSFIVRLILSLLVLLRQ